MSESRYTTYKHVQSAGLPNRQGKYFLIAKNNDLIFAELQLSEDARTWISYPSGAPIDDSIIRMWKPVQIG
jgi:hypothetical protein